MSKNAALGFAPPNVKPLGVKVKSFRAPGPLLSIAAQSRTILRGTFHLAAAWWPAWLLTAVLAIVFTAVLFPHDPAYLLTLHHSHLARQDSVIRLGYFLGTWGDYPTYNLPLAVLLWFYGYATKSHTWRRTAVICFLGATLAGLFDDCFRLTLGRPRPDAHIPDGFYGLPKAWTGHYQSYPSGHAAAVFGTAVALLIAKPWLGSVTTIFALLVVWARMEIYRHYPSDVLVGSMIGITFGLLVGLGARVQRKPRIPVLLPS